MFRRTRKAFSRLRQVGKPSAKGDTQSSSTPNSSRGRTGKRNTGKSQQQQQQEGRKDKEDREFSEWSAAQRRERNLKGRSQKQRGDEKFTCREMMTQPDVHYLVLLLLFLDLFHFAVTSWRLALENNLKAAMAADKSTKYPQEALDALQSQGMTVLSTVLSWASSFSTVVYVLEHILSLFYEGGSHFLSSGRWFDAVALCTTALFTYQGNALLGIFPNLPRMFWRCYHVMRIFVSKAEGLTRRERIRGKRLRGEISRLRKQLSAAKEEKVEYDAALEESKNRVLELERALLIAAESEAVRMDLGTLESYAAKGAENDFRLS